MKPGDVVQLKSGGPLMTYEKKLNNGRIECVWFEELKKHSGIFEETSLKPYKED